MTVDLRQLSYFVAIADSASISAAAAKLGIAQPSLSEVVARLEKQLGVQLMVRTARGMQLTQAGTVLARHARDLLHRVEIALEEVADLGKEARGQISLGLPPTMALLLAVPLAETVRLEYPQIKLRINEYTSAFVLEALGTEQLDIGVSYQGYDFSQFDVQAFVEEELFLIAASDNWPTQSQKDGIADEPVNLVQLESLPLVLPSPPQGLRNLIDRYAKSQNVQLVPSLEMDGLQPVISLALRASAYTILSHAAVAKEVSSGELMLVPIANPRMTHSAYVVRKRGRPISRASVIIENLLFAILKEITTKQRLRAKLQRT